MTKESTRKKKRNREKNKREGKTMVVKGLEKRKKGEKIIRRK